MNRVLSIVALLMLTLGTWAANTVDDVNVNVKPNADAGTVTKAVDDKGVCTLTVTPATGYYLTEDNLAAVATVKGEAIQAPRRNLPIDNGELPITPDDNNTDPAGVTKYTFTIPEGCNVEVTAEFQSMAVYDLYIGTTRVTELNASDVLKDGKVSFTPATDNTPATLTLNGAAITAPLKVGLANLTIDIQGENTITTSEACLQNLLGNDATPALTFMSTSSTVGSLILTHEGGVSQIGEGSITLSSELAVLLTVYGYDDYTSRLYYITDGSTSVAKIVPSLGVQVGETQVYSGNATNVLNDEGTPTVVYDAENHKLTLNNASINNGGIITSLENLTIELIGNNTLSSGGTSTFQSSTGNAVTLTIQSGEPLGNLTLNMSYSSSGDVFVGNNVTLDIVSPLAVVSGRLTGNNTNDNSVTIGEAKGLVVGGYAVTEDNCNDILNDGTLSYDFGTNTLTLSGATLYPYNDWCVQVGSELSYLNVKLLGNNIMRGNAFKFEDSKPALVFKTDPITPGTLLIGPFTEAPAPYSLISPDQENGSQVYYEDNLTSENTVESIMIGGPTISLKVGGVTVTSQNKGDILKDGKVSFDPQTNTLKLDNATIDMTGKDGSPIESNVDDLKVQLIGNNVVTTTAAAFYYTGTQIDDVNLTFTHEENGFGNLTVSGGSLVEAQNYNVTEQSGWTVTTNSVSYDTTFGVQIGSTAFKASALTIDSENGSATYSPIAGTLSLNNFTTADNITTTLENLTIVVTGANSVGAVSYNGQNEDATITIEKNMSSEATINKLVASSLNGFETVTVVDPLNDMSTETQVIISDVVTYNLWVKGTQVNKENMDAIATGVSFDGDAMLTLTNVNTTSDDAPFITNGLSKLTIRLVGTNAVDCGQQVFLAKKEGDINHQVTFITDANAVGKLTVKVSESNSWYTGHSKVTLLNKLQEDSKVLDMIKTVTIEAPTAEYGLSVNGVALTNLNANDVFKDGSVKYDATTNVLTLRKAQLEGDIISDIDELFIQLHGDCEVNAFDRTVDSQGKLKFSLGGNQGGLKLNSAIPTAKFEVTTADRLTFDEDKKVLALPTYYGITVASIKIDSENRLHVLGKGNESVIFDNNAQLILNNATINGEIVVDKASSLPDNTLTINLSGQNTINLDNTQKAIKCNEGTLTLVITLADKTASLAINNDVNEITKDNVFSGVTSTYDGLSVLNKPGNHLLMITTLLPPVVNQEGQAAETDFKNDMNPGTNTNNQNIKGVLYTMGDEKSDKDNSSGYDQTQGALVFVGAAAMTEEKLQQVLEEKPGTQTYADRFTGLTFALPAGSSIIKIASYISDPDYAFYIQVGDQEPVEVESGFGNTSAAMALTSLKIVVGQAGIVKLFMMKKKKTENQEESGAPQMDMVNRRIGPKSSVAGGLGGISVQSNAIQSSEGPAETYKSIEKKSISKAISAVTNVRNGYSCSDPNITDLPNNMFVKENTMNAPSRRGAAVETILPEGLTFVDFSNTKITGMEVSRTSGAFNGVPENVFIYMPAGNTTKEKNVVIGGICDKMELDGSENAKPFKALKNFKVGQAVLKREFAAAGSDNSMATIYLPYAIPQEEAFNLGVFYEYVGNNGTEVQMNMVTTGGLKANKPYIFKAPLGGVKDPLVRVVDVVATPVETEGFKGVYERMDYEDGMYCYAAEPKNGVVVGQFVEMGPGSWVPPFRAYMIGNGAPSYAIAWDGEVDNIQNEENQTAVETVKTVADKKVAEGWWTINGMRLNAQPKKAGLYIKDGKMVVIK